MTIQDYSDAEDISGLKGFHYRRIFDGYKRDGSPRYKYKVVLDGKYIKSPLKADADIFAENNRKLIIPDSVKNHKIVGDKFEVKIKKMAPGNKRWTETSYKVWNGNDYVMPGDPTLVPDRAGDSPAVDVEEVSSKDSEVIDSSISYTEDTGNIFTQDLLKIDWTGNIGNGTYDEPLKISSNNSMPSTKWANTADGDYYSFKGKRYKKGSVSARKADNIMAAKEKAKQMARLRIENKGV